MKMALSILCAAAVGWGVTAASAAACSPGYKKVKVGPHYVCALDVSPTNKLKARTKAPR